MKYAVISSDANTDYLFYLPLTCFSWARLGYTPVVWLAGDDDFELPEAIKKNSFGAEFKYFCGPATTVKESTCAQVIRLFPDPTWNDDDIMITGDADMLVCKDIFTQDVREGQIISYGYDLTGRSELPICYVKAMVGKWREMMKIKPGTTVQEFIGEFWDDAKSPDWNRYWSVDQKLLTARAKAYGYDKIIFVDRGFAGPIAANRWDRYCWDKVPDDIIDVHMLRSPLHEERWPLVKDMVKRLWPDDNWEWLEDYKKEFENIL